MLTFRFYFVQETPRSTFCLIAVSSEVRVLCFLLFRKPLYLLCDAIRNQRLLHPIFIFLVNRRLMPIQIHYLGHHILHYLLFFWLPLLNLLLLLIFPLLLLLFLIFKLLLHHHYLKNQNFYFPLHFLLRNHILQPRVLRLTFNALPLLARIY